MNSILLSVPTRGSIAWTVVKRLEEIRDAHPGLSPILYQASHTSEALSRNTIIHQFLQGDWDVLAMVDDDTVPPPNFLEAAQFLTEYDMVGIPYPMVIQDAIQFTIFDAVKEDSQVTGYEFVEPVEGINECDAIGGGCMLIHRRVFDKLGAAPFHSADDPEQFVTADLLFCRDAKAQGCKIGYWWDQWYADHHTAVGLGPLKEMQALLMSAILPEHNPFSTA